MDNTTDRGEDLQPLSRVLLGLLLLGGEELTRHVRQSQEQLEAKMTVADEAWTARDETPRDWVRHLAIGMLVRGRKRIAGGVHKGVRLSVGTADRMAGKLDQWTDNRLMRPVRRPIESRWKRLRQYAGRVAEVGRREEQSSRLLAAQTVDGAIDEIMAYISHNPELALLIREQIAAQSAGLAEVVAGNTRQVTVAGDEAVEGVVRRFLRRKPRGTLPLSPFVGKPQTMYRGKIRK